MWEIVSLTQRFGELPPDDSPNQLVATYFAPRAKRCESVAALMARSLRLEPSCFRTACCWPVLVEVEVHEGLVKQGSLLQQVDENVAAIASTTLPHGVMLARAR